MNVEVQSDLQTKSNQRAASGPDSAAGLFAFPAVFAQKRLWFFDQLQPGNTSYNIVWSLRVAGNLNVEALIRSLNEIVRRHEVLRTTFSAVDGEVMQLVAPLLTLRVPITDLTSDPQAERGARQAAALEGQKALDLKSGPLVRARLLRLDVRTHILLLTLHHIIFDGWSRGILASELAVLYESYSAGRTSPLPEPRLQFGDYAVWQREHFLGRKLDEQLEYWKHRLHGASTSLDLPTDGARPAMQSFAGAAQAIHLPVSLTEQLRDLALSEQATLFMVLLAGFDILLARYSGQSDILVGTPIASRGRPEIEDLIGLFASTLVLRAELSDNPTFRELLGRVKNDALGAYAHQDLPFEKLVEELRPARSLSQNPLFQVMFSLQNAPRRAFELPGLEVKLLDTAGSTAKFDISLFLVESADGLRGRLEYNTDLFEAATIGRMLEHYQVLLAAVVVDPQARCSELPLLTAPERRQLLRDWNAREVDYPRELCLHQLFEGQVQRTPQAVACQFKDEQLTYAQLNARANQLAHWLRKRQVGPGQRVGLLVERSLEMMIGLLGIQKSGAAYVPLDPAYPAERIRLTLEDAEVCVLVTQRSLVERIAEGQLDVVCLDSEISRESTVNLPQVATAEDLIYVIFTSGSTGRPKGVQIPHRAVVNLLSFMAKELRMGPSDVFPALASVAFDMCIPELYLALICGGRVVLGERHLAANGEELASLLRQAGATIVHATPTTWNLLLEAGFSGKGLKRVVGAEPLPRELCTRLLQADNSLYNFYGPTETTVWSTFHHFHSEHEPLVVGRPVANTQVYILDQNLQPTPIGVPGEIHIAGDGVACGYRNRAELTAQKFISDPFARRPGAKMYKSGDIGRFLADGRIEFQGRSDHQVKVRGYRIELGEVEVVLGSHPAVRECVVVAREDVAGDKRLVGYVVGSSEQPVDVADLRTWVKGRLPDYMVPAAFVSLAQLPLSPNGKVDRASLPVPDYTRAEPGRIYVHAVTPAEEVIAGTWAQVLQLDRVGTQDDFFELGGHSLLATQVVSRIRREFQVELPLRALFEVPTVAALAQRVEALKRQKRRLEIPPLHPVAHDQHLPLSFAQERLWVLDRLEPENPLYNVCHSVRVPAALDPTVLEQTLNEIARRHQALRTTFRWTGDEPVQVIAPSLSVPLVVTDLTSLPSDQREATARQLGLDDVNQPFNLAAGPLIRARLFKLGDTDHVLLVCTHHIVSDGWSMGVLWQELAIIYEAYAAARPSPLPDLTVQYADYAVWQRQVLSDRVLEQQLSYWTEQLEGAGVLDLPTDRPRPPEQTFRGARLSVLISQEQVKQLEALGRKEGATLFMTLLATFSVLLSRYSGQQDIVLGSPIAGRTNADVERLIGLFVNTILLRTDLSGDPSFRGLLARVREAAMGAYAHQDVPFEKLVAELKPERDLSRNPLFQVMLILQNMPAVAQTLTCVRTVAFLMPVVSAKFDLTVIAAQAADGLRVAFEYSTDLFDQSTVERMAQHFKCLLQGVVDNPSAAISELPLLTRAERQQILIDWNSTRAPYPGACLHGLVAAQARRTPERVAVVCGAERLSYADLESRSNQLAHYLRKLGVDRETLVGLCLERSPDLLVGLLGILKAGGAYVPLDPTYPPDRMQFILDDAQAPVLITQQRLIASLPKANARTIVLDAVWFEIAAESTEALASNFGSDSLAYVLYTSGSTGKPKGVQIEHRNVVNFLAAMQKCPGLTREDSLLAVTTLSFDIAGLELYLPLITGAKLVLASREEAADGNRLLALLNQFQISMLQATPTTWRMLLDSGWSGTSTLKALCGGEALPADLASQLLPRCGELWNMYGPTETTIWSSVFRVGPGLAGTVPIGRPISNTTMYVLDAKCHPVPVGVAGELYIGGHGVARGYLRRPELSAEKFLADPFRPGERLYRTGDRAKFLQDGNIQFLGRTDFQVKVRGFRIELGEIESALTEHPAIRQAVVVAREDRPGDTRLAAYLVPSDGGTAGPAELRLHLRRKLPEYMVPSSFVTLDSLPLTLSGKIDRKALKEQDYVRPQPAAGQEAQQPGTVTAPRDDFEHIVLRVWQRVLGTEHIGRSDSFFDVGGHSLLAVRMLNDLRRVTGQEIPLAELFRGATIEHLARILRADTPPVAHLTLMEIQPRGTAPPFFAVAAPGVNTLGYLVLSQVLGPDQPLYMLQGAGAERLVRPYTESDIEQLAADYVRSLRAVQAEGPYHMGGMCEGTRIAFEMARILESQGQEVGLLATFDTWAVENSQIRALWYLHSYGRSLGQLWKVPLLGKAKAVVGLLRKKVRREEPADTFNRAAWHAYYWPRRHFVPKISNTQITAFKLRRQPFYYVRDPLMGWGTRTTKGVVIHLIEGKHLQMLREPSVRSLGDALSKCLRRAQISHSAKAAAAAGSVSTAS
ncbi:MAG: Non-ribosomal peptide synthetase component [Gammaproteobacteria bacterium]|nr:Non-ribosomal peptide synthetase component [Gammaproteobacteria bacterium]